MPASTSSIAPAPDCSCEGNILPVEEGFTELFHFYRRGDGEKIGEKIQRERVLFGVSQLVACRSADLAQLPFEGEEE